jgi:hypothetical protein
MKQLELEDYATLTELSKWLEIDVVFLQNQTRTRNWKKYIDKLHLLVDLPTRKTDKTRKQLVAHYLVGDVVKFLQD